MASETEFHTIEDVRAYIKREVEAHIEREKRKTRAWNTARFAAWLVLLVVAFFQYYFIGVLQESMSLQTLQVNVPVKVRPTGANT